MGAEAKTTLRVGKQSFTGTALLETDELLFRGDTRLRIPLTSITGVAVKSGVLHVTHDGGVAAFALGDVSAKWAEKIRNPRTRVEKLGVKPGMRVALLGVADEAIRGEIAGAGATTLENKVPADTAMVLWFIAKPNALAKLPTIARSIARDGAIWVIHPRGVAAVADTVIFAAAKEAGLTATKVLRFNETDTAEKLVIPRSAR